MISHSDELQIEKKSSAEQFGKRPEIPIINETHCSCDSFFSLEKEKQAHSRTHFSFTNDLPKGICHSQHE